MINLTTRCGKSDPFLYALPLAFSLVIAASLSAQERPLFPIQGSAAQQSILELTDSGAVRTASLSGNQTAAQDPIQLPPTIELLPPPNRQEQDVPALPQQSAEQEPQVLMRGPLHEAFADVHQADPQPNPLVEKTPPEPIQELPPEFKPEGENVEWIPGYWAFDEDQSDFIWISGVWRDVPPNQRWVPGYWEQADSGFRWISGFWTSIEQQQLNYVPAPPVSLDQGPSVAAPSDDYFYCPGNWEYQSNRFVWRTGHWQPRVANWIWIPARYVWTPRGCIYRAGYWDYEFDVRGTAFAPVYFPQQIYRAPNYFYRPSFSINTGADFFVHLFVRPNCSQYFYGDWYGSGHGHHYRPWIYPHSHHRHYDPLLTHYSSARYRYHNDSLFHWVTHQHRFYADHLDLRPRITLNAHLDFSRSRHDHRHDDYIHRAKLADNYLDRIKREDDHRHDQKRTVTNERRQKFVRVDSDEQHRHQVNKKTQEDIRNARKSVERKLKRGEVDDRDTVRIPVDRDSNNPNRGNPNVGNRNNPRDAGGNIANRGDANRGNANRGAVDRDNPKVELPKITAPNRTRPGSADGNPLTKQQIDKAQRDVEKAQREAERDNRKRDLEQKIEQQRQQRDAAREQRKDKGGSQDKGSRQDRGGSQDKSGGQSKGGGKDKNDRGKKSGGTVSLPLNNPRFQDDDLQRNPQRNLQQSQVQRILELQRNQARKDYEKSLRENSQRTASRQSGFNNGSRQNQLRDDLLKAQQDSANRSARQQRDIASPSRQQRDIASQMRQNDNRAAQNRARQDAQQKDLQRQRDKSARAMADQQRHAALQAKIANDRAQRESQQRARQQQVQADQARRSQQRAAQAAARRQADQQRKSDRQQKSSRKQNSQSDKRSKKKK